MDITLALGGGGARGLAHIGVLRVLEREGYHIRAVAGTSMGGVIAAAYASTGSSAAVRILMQERLGQELFRARPDGDGLIGLSAIASRLQEHFQDRTFADLLLPCAVTAVEIDTGREVVLQEGDVKAAVLATIALPGIFPPREHDDQRLVDGGVVDPVPVRAARNLYRAPVVASVLSPPQEEWADRPSPSPLTPLPVFDLLARIRPGRALQIFVRSMEISERSFTELRLHVDRPEVIIRPDVAHIALLDAPDVEEVAKLGEQAAVAALPALRAQFTFWRRLLRWLGFGRRA
jgi:NTE family protein